MASSPRDFDYSDAGLGLGPATGRELRRHVLHGHAHALAQVGSCGVRLRQRFFQGVLLLQRRRVVRLQVIHKPVLGHAERQHAQVLNVRNLQSDG